MRSTRLKIATLSLMLAGLVFSAMPVAAQKDYRALQFPPLNDIVTPTPTRVVLDNGIILYLVEDRRLPMINLSARFGVGAVNEPADKIGLAGITGAVNLLGPEAVVVMGGVTAAGDLFFGPLAAELGRPRFRSALDACTVVPGALPGTAGVVGAAGVFRLRTDPARG